MTFRDDIWFFIVWTLLRIDIREPIEPEERGNRLRPENNPSPQQTERVSDTPSAALEASHE